jgi:F-type H+-transporting ATPase subunit b
MLEINLTLPIMTVMFLVFAIGMNLVFFGPVTRALEARKAHIASQQAAAAASVEAARALQLDYETRLKAAQVEAQAAIQAALKAAEANRQVLLGEVKAEVAGELSAARATIRLERDHAMAALAGEAGGFSDLIQRKVLGEAAPASLAAASAQQGGA